jgi:hypothetical protein
MINTDTSEQEIGEGLALEAFQDSRLFMQTESQPVGMFEGLQETSQGEVNMPLEQNFVEDGDTPKQVELFESTI